jgi:pimeloyl-ACP methyl ester carboxylesterase
VAAVWGQFDQGTQRAFLRLHRSIDSAGLAAAGAAAPERVPGAGHWPWLDQPSVIQRVGAFLIAPA